MTEVAGSIYGSQDSRAPALRWIGYALTVVIPIILWFAPLTVDLTAKHALAISSFMIVAWITEAMPHTVTGLFGCYLFWVLKVVKFNVAFGGFADQTPWFLFGAALLGMMATKSGLARRLAYIVMRRVGGGYPRILLGFILSSFLLTFLVPSGIACVVIMAAIAMGLMEVFRLGRGSNVGRGIFITLTYTAGTFDKMVIAGPSSILGRGLIENGAHVHVYYSLWLLAFLPCTIVTIFCIWRLVLWLYPPEKDVLSVGMEFIHEELRKMGPWTPLEKKSLLFMLAAITLWMTDLLHHISPAMIGIGVGLLAAVPRLGVLNQDDLKKINYLPVFFTATAICMGDVLLQTRALDAMTTVMFSWMGSHITNIYALAIVPYWTAFVYHIFLGNEISMLATSVPPLMHFALSRGLPALPLGMVWVFAAGGKIFVYQSGVMVTGYSYGYFEARDLFRVGICLSLIESLVLLLTVPFYWPLLGIQGSTLGF
jgi:solute carrier family 13 (sodium-dependent dicarboxylate transporter), member 2/3/5